MIISAPVAEIAIRLLLRFDGGYFIASHIFNNLACSKNTLTYLKPLRPRKDVIRKSRLDTAINVVVHFKSENYFNFPHVFLRKTFPEK